MTDRKSRFAEQNTEAAENSLRGLKPQCLNCVWLDKTGQTRNVCRAFPNGIPREIRLNEVDHRLPYPGDNGFQFLPVAEGLTFPVIKMIETDR